MFNIIVSFQSWVTQILTCQGSERERETQRERERERERERISVKKANLLHFNTINHINLKCKLAVLIFQVH